MAIDDRLNQMLRVEQEIRSMHAELSSSGKSLGGGGSGPVDERIARLESRLDKVGDELGGVKVSLATLAERVAHLPSKGFIVTTSTTALALLAAIVVFADNIKAAIAG